MTTDQVEPYHVHVNTGQVTTGAILFALGGTIAFAGMAIGAVAVFNAALDFMRHMQTPPRELAARRWRQAKEAASSGAQAWRAAAPRNK
jgi:hypothetical protein